MFLVDSRRWCPGDTSLGKVYIWTILSYKASKSDGDVIQKMEFNDI